MPMAGRSTQEPTSMGNDEMHRMRVSRKYERLSEIKPKLNTSIKVLNAFYLALLAVSLFSYNEYGKTIIHPVTLLGVGFQFLAKPAMRNNNPGLMVAFSTLTGFMAAYLLYMGVGRSVTLIQIQGPSNLLVSTVIVSAMGCAGHLFAVVYARQLIDVMSIDTRPRAKPKSQ
eukprot:gene9469-1711_t